MTDDEITRSILDGVAYMVLATADDDGLPWASPVWFAMDGHDDLYWISRPEARHSRNIAARAEVGIVVFDSTNPPAARQAVYMRADAHEVGESRAIARGVAAFSRDSLSQGLDGLTVDEVTGVADLRLFHARVREHWILEADHDVRVRTYP
jgi:hypothetical protein